MSRRAGELPQLGSEFAVARARSAGVSAGRLRGRDLARPFRGVRASPAGSEGLDDLVARCRAFLTVMASDAVFSHTTAAILYGIPIPWRLERTTGSLHVTGPRRASTARGIIGHQSTLDPLDVTGGLRSLPGISDSSHPLHLPDQHEALVETMCKRDPLDVAGRREGLRGLRVTSPERTLCDLAPLLSLGELVAAVDRALFHGGPLVTRSSLADGIARHRARRGRATLLRAMELATDLAESPRESLLRVLLIEAGLPAPTPQVRVQDAFGREIARVDLAYPAHRIALEYEGDHHRTDRLQWRRDLARTRDLGLAGWETLRVTQLDLDSPAEMLLQLRYWLTTLTPMP
ncbi:hypothetical protein ACEXQD_01830 [Herbiconiux sp. P15]|uniref:hypothetical protein n=1 Tax=Herbiconiux liukaitaii TaxID=3342799 RepID=UPI0035B8232A